MTHVAQIGTGPLVLDRSITISDAIHVAAGDLRIVLGEAAVERCRASHSRLQRVIAENRHVYGITTGFGPLANRLIGVDNGVQLQQNLINHLASGVGPDFSWIQSRAIMLSRLMSILQGASGASAALIDMLVALLNSGFAPVVPSRGTVGASGDLTPLAHMALCLQGRGAFVDATGAQVSNGAVFGTVSQRPLDLADRDALALVNGTSAMTGIACLNATATDHAVHWAIATTAALSDVLGGRVEAWHACFGQLRPHPGQIMVADGLRKRLAGSKNVVRTPIAERRLGRRGLWTEDIAGQDAYCLRCAPQVIGAVVDLADWHARIVATELCAATDNPLFPADELSAIALHGGNFMGQHVGLASDALSNGLTVLGGLVERQIARVTDEKLNNGLPAFLHRGESGLNSGLMGAQVTASALLAEMRAIGPASAHSISTNGANQDVVSMGTIAARLAADKLTHLACIQAIMCIAMAQAVDIRLAQDNSIAFSACTMALHRFVRSHSDAIETDRPLGREIEAIAAAISANAPPD